MTRPRPDGPGTPFDGVTVMSLEQAVAAPLVTRHLADLGARVIKVERPRSGDFVRADDRTVHGQASYFVWLNLGKQSVELDLKDPPTAPCSVPPTCWCRTRAPGAASRLGLDAATVRADRPDLVHCSISGYGPDGPYRDKKAYDLLVQCEAGLPMTTGTSETPSKAGISVADISTGHYAYSSVLAALYRRERTGAGASVSRRAGAARPGGGSEVRAQSGTRRARRRDPWWEHDPGHAATVGLHRRGADHGRRARPQ